MDAAFYVLAGSLVLGYLGGLVAGIGFRMASARRCTRLEWAMGDVQARLATVQNRGKANSRWEKSDKEQLELAQLMQETPARTKRYDNDPLGEL